MEGKRFALPFPEVTSFLCYTGLSWKNLGFITHLLPQPSGLGNVRGALRRAPGCAVRARLAAGQPGCVCGSWCPQAWPSSTIPTSQAGKGEPGQEQATSCPLYLSAWQHRSSFGGAGLQPSPDRRGREEAESDLYFLGHVFRDSQLKLGSL